MLSSTSVSSFFLESPATPMILSQVRAPAGGQRGREALFLMPGNGCVPVDVAVIAEPSKLAIHLIGDFLQCPTVQVDTPKAGVVLPVESREQNVLAVPGPQRTFISILWIGSDLAHLLAIGIHDPDSAFSQSLPGGLSSSDGIHDCLSVCGARRDMQYDLPPVTRKRKRPPPWRSSAT